MYVANVAPASIDSREVDFGYRLESAQKYPWCGKLKLRDENALAEAGAARNELEDMRLQLAESAAHAFYEYYLVARALEANEETLAWLSDAKQNAETRYKTGLAPEQDLLQASVEIGREEQRRLTLERMQNVAV